MTYLPMNAFAETTGDSNDGLGNLKVIDSKEARKNDPFMIIHDKPLEENSTVIPLLRSNAKALTPPYLFELARRLWITDKSSAMEWFALGMARSRYDALRCVDKTSHQGILYLPAIAPDVREGIESERKAFSEAGLKALNRPDLFVDSVSPMWICMHGMGMINSAIQGKQLTEKDWLRPSSEWDGIKQEVKNDLKKYFEEQGRPQDDPIPMTTSLFPIQNIFQSSPRITIGISDFNWLDDQHLVIARNEKNEQGKFDKHLVIVSSSGEQTDFAKLAGNDRWCVGREKITYQTNIKKLDEKLSRVTFNVGTPEKWSSEIQDLPSYNPQIDQRQSFSGINLFSRFKTTQSPFDCQWVTNEALSANIKDNWFSLLPDHGTILMEGEGERNVVWINTKGEKIVLPVDNKKSALGRNSFRYLDWQGAYFVAEGYSRFFYKDRPTPECIAAAYIYPKDGRVEKSCIPFDKETTSDQVKYTPSRIGLLRFTTQRNTPHGLKNGGVYLIRPGGKTEKILDSEVDSWNVSPTGCRLAIRHQGLSRLDVIDLCLGE